MRVVKSKAAFLREAINEWTTRGLLTKDTAQTLNDDIHVIPFQWRKAARLSFLIAVICFVIAISAVLLDKELVALIQKIFKASALLKCVTLFTLSAALYAFGLNRSKHSPLQFYRNEAIMFGAVLTTAGAIYQLGQTFATSSSHFSLLILLSYFVYASIGFYTQSILIWVFSLLSLGGWLGAETGYVSGWGAYYLGMNYPLRFILFGGSLTAIALALKPRPLFTPFYRSTLAMGLLYLFIALWLLSIFGNYDSVSRWLEVKQIELMHWSLMFAMTAIAAYIHGIKTDETLTKNFGVVFLLINLYTRFFELFWKATNKAIFFSILGLSFWALGTYAEKIWAIGQKKES